MNAANCPPADCDTPNASRVAQRAFEGLSVERELERADVPLFAANEPITLTGSRAQRILQRRINQSVAEYEVLNILEQSWARFVQHPHEPASAVSCWFPPRSRSRAVTAARAVTLDDREHRAEPAP